MDALKKDIQMYPDSYCRERGERLGASATGIRYAQYRLGVSYKKTFTYMETQETKRKEYKEIIKDISSDKLVYIDESGIEAGIAKDRGWRLKGKKLSSKRSGKYYKRTNIIAGLAGNKPIAPGIFNGLCDTKLFEAWVEHFLIKELKLGQFVVMNNASFHKSQKTKKLIESARCKIIFLPPYSPDLNPIEKFWANMKQWIKNNIFYFDRRLDTVISLG